jgi:NAD+ synthase (glutamine-hydrolysing)
LQLSAAYILSANGSGESTQDVVFGGRCFIAEYGSVMAEMPAFDESNKMIIADIDVERLRHKRLKSPCFAQNIAKSNLRHIELQGLANAPQPTALKRPLSTLPFIPEKALRNDYFENILSIQAHGLAKRITHTHAQTAVLGISGGLDSTLALLATVQSFDLLGKDRKQIIGITMPGFGTTGRTYTNALQLMQLLGITTREIRITDAVTQHFKDINHDINKHDVTYENSQARERTQILMDIANQMNGMVIGTGDLSELALGWATYNGDHMSMYAVNASIPKTMMRFLVTWVAQNTANQQIKSILLDIVDTPVSPELMPADEQGNIKQKTEDLVGPYELHDFFLYYMLRYGFAPDKIYRLAAYTFEGEYDSEVVLKWLKIFYRRFFAQQFKRSCLPDGPKVGSVGVSPRGDLRMPSDASARIWLDALEEM